MKLYLINNRLKHTNLLKLGNLGFFYSLCIQLMISILKIWKGCYFIIFDFHSSYKLLNHWSIRTLRHMYYLHKYLLLEQILDCYHISYKKKERDCQLIINYRKFFQFLCIFSTSKLEYLRDLSSMPHLDKISIQIQ